MNLVAPTQTEETAENEVIIRVEGMMCEHCEKRVKDTLEVFDEIESAEPDFTNGTVKLAVKSQIDLKKLKKAISSAGYKMK